MHELCGNIKKSLILSTTSWHVAETRLLLAIHILPSIIYHHSFFYLCLSIYSSSHFLLFLVKRIITLQTVITVMDFAILASASVLPPNIQNGLPLGWTRWISLQSKGLSKFFFNTRVQKHQFTSAKLRLWAPKAEGPRLIPCRETVFHKLKLKIPHAATKTWSNQINKNVFPPKKEHLGLHWTHPHNPG